MGPGGGKEGRRGGERELTYSLGNSPSANEHSRLVFPHAPAPIQPYTTPRTVRVRSGRGVEKERDVPSPTMTSFRRIYHPSTLGGEEKRREWKWDEEERTGDCADISSVSWSKQAPSLVVVVAVLLSCGGWDSGTRVCPFFTSFSLLGRPS